MPPRSTADIRSAYLNFFSQKHGHAVIPSASLIPENDPTVLFTTAGMHPLVPYLLGESHPSGKRLVDVQRCIRTQDIDEVGDASHLTFFEMLGNWSLGDYFKEGAIKMSFQFITEVLEMPVTRIAVTCFAGDKDAPKDDESAKIWMSLGIPAERIVFLPKKDNWWGPAGRTGPCGPDTEMFVWVGEGEPHGNPAENSKDWLEIWNDVFMQYHKKEDGTFESLKQKNVDTGMGLERTAAVMQGVKSVYEIDAMRPIFDHVAKITGAFHSEGVQDNPILLKEVTRHVRIIVDHLKASVFIIADGITPSNVDQGYVLRRLIRRAIRSAHKIGLEKGSFTASVAAIAVQQYQNVYSNLFNQLQHIKNILEKEEEQFRKTLDEGLKHTHRVLDKISEGGVMDGKTAFHLYDTYGFPLEQTIEEAKECGMTVDQQGFQKAFEEHQTLSRAGALQRFSGGLADHSAETTKLHTATHLLNAALRKVLGDHVFQKGSNITAERLRFDFSHPEKMTKEQIAEVERIVNDAIVRDFPVAYHVTTAERANEEGAIGVFGERYGTEVKVYVVGSAGDVYSREICGGPHVTRTGMLGSFKILKEESSSAGVRRIKAVVSGGPDNIDVAGLGG